MSGPGGRKKKDCHDKKKSENPKAGPTGGFVTDGLCGTLVVLH